MAVVDLNCDSGESFGVYQKGETVSVLPYVTSLNIACGFHAGDPHIMRETVKLALEQNVAIGAHPGLPDLQGFGRRWLEISPLEAYEMTVYQIGALEAMVRAEGGTMHHVKPHGALYNKAATDTRYAEAIAQAVAKVNDQLILYGMSGSALIRAGQALGLRTASEVFADRTYQDDGTLTPRNLPGALIHNKDQAVQQVLQMVIEQKVTTQSGKEIPIQADTICIYGDGDQSVLFAKKIYYALLEQNVTIQTP
jgi:UPF0271 protein